MAMQGERESLREAFQWLLAGLLPGELEEGQQGIAKHFLEKMVDEAKRVSAPKATTSPTDSLCMNKAVALPTKTCTSELFLKRSLSPLPSSLCAAQPLLHRLLLPPTSPHRLPNASHFYRAPPSNSLAGRTADSHTPPWSSKAFPPCHEQPGNSYSQF